MKVATVVVSFSPVCVSLRFLTSFDPCPHIRHPMKRLCGLWPNHYSANQTPHCEKVKFAFQTVRRPVYVRSWFLFSNGEPRNEMFASVIQALRGKTLQVIWIYFNIETLGCDGKTLFVEICIEAARVNNPSCDMEI